MLHTTKAIVLHALKYRESSLLVTMYTEKFGIQKYMVKGVRGKTKKKGNANVFQSLFLLELEAYNSPSKDIQMLKEYRITSPFLNVPFDILKSTQAQFLAEFLYRTVKEEEPRKELFDYLFHSIQMLDLLEAGVGNFHLRFLLQLSRYLGYSPQTRDDEEGNKQWFDLNSGQFHAREPLHSSFLDTNRSEKLQQLQSTSFDELSKIAMGPRDREYILQHLIQYYEIHIGHQIQLKSLPILHEIFEE